jgi:PAS domain-containing protein
LQADPLGAGFHRGFHGPLHAAAEAGALGQLLSDVLETGHSLRENEAEVYVDGKDGSKKFYIDYEYAPLREPDGSVTGILVTVADVTEKVEARQKVEEAEQRSRLAIDAAAMGTFDWDLVNQKFISSPRLIEIFGFGDHLHTAHQDLINAFHWDDKPSRDNAVAKSFEKGSLSYEARVIWPDKTVHWIRVYGKTIYDEHYNPTRMHGTVLP